MRSASTPSSLVAALLLTGCFAEPASHQPFRCDSNNPCPSTQSCVSGLCMDTMTGVELGGASSDGGDAGTSGGDMATGSGCADGKGTKIGASAWACPGTFQTGKAQSLCKNGYSLAVDASKVNLATCNGLTGFFIANVFGKYLPPWGGSISCMLGGAFDSKVVFGCGGATGTGYEPDSTTKCSGYSRAADYPNAGKGSSDPFDISQLSNTVSADGAICVL